MGGTPFDIADIDCQHASGPNCLCKRHERSIDGICIGQVVQSVSNSDNRIDFWNPVVRQSQPDDLFGPRGDLVSKAEHRRRRVTRHDTVAGIDQLFCEKATSTANFQHQTMALSDRLQ
jgi:hypothetical protein